MYGLIFTFVRFKYDIIRNLIIQTQFFMRNLHDDLSFLCRTPARSFLLYLQNSSKNIFNFQSYKIKNTSLLKSVFFLSLFLFFYAPSAIGQQNPNESQWTADGYSLKKVVSNTSIQTGVNFSYTIIYSAPAGATTIHIEDEVPAALQIVSVPTPLQVNGIAPVINISGQTVSYDLTGLPAGSSSSGSFTIVVKFPEGVTCNGTSVRNRAGIRIGDKMNYTPHVNTTALAEDPWVIKKTILHDGKVVVNPMGGNCGYLIAPDDTATYRLYVTKANGFYGTVTGQHNMSNAVVTDQLPPGAVFISSTCGISAPLTGNTFTWQPNNGNLDATNPHASYYCDIKIYYPAGAFPVGTFINNEASLNGEMCNQQVEHTSNQTCIEVAAPITKGTFGKYLYMTNRVPGCDGYYYIPFRNTGNVALSHFIINDVIPAGITVTSVSVAGGSSTTTMSLTANNGQNIINQNITTNYFNSPSLNFTVNDLKWEMTGSLPPNNGIYLYIYFTVDPNTPGTDVENCATFNGLSNNLTLNPVCTTFKVGDYQPIPCVLKEICSPKESYDPGEIIRFRLRVQNVGSATMSGANLEDILSSHFTYVGNETYYTANTYNVACSGSGSIPAGANAWSGVTTNHSNNNLSWNLPDIESDCQLFYTANCGYYGTTQLPYYYVEFDVQIDSLAPAGISTNSFEALGGNITNPVSSNSVNILVTPKYGQQAFKELSDDNGSTYGATANVNAGGTARYRLNYKNLSNVPLTSVEFVDLLPRNDGSNDWLVLDRNIPRGSQFDVSYVNTSTHATTLQPSGTAPAPAIAFASGQNICLPDYNINLSCNTVSWSSQPDSNVKMNYGSFMLPTGVILQEGFNVQVPASATPGQNACNDFAAVATASFILDGTVQTVSLTPIAAPPVCLTVKSGTSDECCKSTKVEVIQDPDLGDCCLQISTECEVDSIVLIANGGTFAHAEWNCGAIPADYIGKTNYTFKANLCNVTMKVCLDPTDSGAISLGYSIHYSNGEVCQNKIQMDCKVNDEECCDKVKAEAFSDPKLGDCCLNLTSECEVKEVEMRVINGSFSYVDWNCGNLSNDYIGKDEYTFNANDCALDMKVCVLPASTGTVTVNYVIHFSNGEVCEKRIVMDCKAPPSTTECCPILDFKLKRVGGFKFGNYEGTFTIINPDPLNPICGVEINASPSVNFTPGQLIVDGNPSNQSWNGSNIPLSGTLNPPAANTLTFTMRAFNYKGVVEICLIRCDGTRCCYEQKWNGKIILDEVVIDFEQVSTGKKLAAVSVKPNIVKPVDEQVKYISLGYDIDQNPETAVKLFAVSIKGGECEDENGAVNLSPVWMGEQSAFFELTCPINLSRSEKLPTFNLVFEGGLPELGYSMFDPEGNEILVGDIKLTAPDSVISTSASLLQEKSSMLELLNLYPNPTNGSFRITYATAERSNVEIRLVNQLGQVLRIERPAPGFAGVHTLDMNTGGIAAGMYHVQLISGDNMRTRKIVIDK